MAPTAQGDDDPQVTNPQPQEPSTSTPEISEGAGPSSSTNGNNEKKPSNRATNKQKKKRAREAAVPSRDERDLKDRQNYYQRLLHSCTKHVRKCLKEAKNLECTKIARQLKKQGGGGECRTDSHDGGGGRGEEPGDGRSDSHSESGDERKRQDDSRTRTTKPPSMASSVHTLDSKYRQMKALEVEPAVAVVLKRLGILNLDPNPVVGATGSALPKATTPKAADHSSEHVERLLRHAKVRSCMEKWNDQVTEYRRWCLRQDEMRTAGGGGKEAAAKGKASHSKRRRTGAGAAAAAEAATTAASFQHSVFARLGAGESGSDDSENDGGSDSNDDGYGSPGRDRTNKSKEKKNRPGQRARKAKAEAIRAKESGATRTTQSLNWREPKTNKEGAAARRHRTSVHDGDATQRPEPRRESRGASTASHPAAAPSAQDDKAHPSWQAKSLKSNTGGIVAFQGTKITFD